MDLRYSTQVGSNNVFASLQDEIFCLEFLIATWANITRFIMIVIVLYIFKLANFSLLAVFYPGLIFKACLGVV